jgi:galactokinase
VARLVAPRSREALERRTAGGFERRFGRSAEFVVSAPGRANLIGEHTDYNNGLVLPFAIQRRTAIAAAPRADRTVRVASALAEGDVTIDLDRPIHRSLPRWGDYVRGVLAEWIAAVGPLQRGFDAWIDSDVPVGAGLSSSAALEVATANLLESSEGTAIAPEAKAGLCCRAEHRYAGVPCGIMDQMASVLSDGTPLLIDCRDLGWRPVAIPAGQVQIVVVDSCLSHDLGQGEFARRVAECREAARLLDVASLREASREAVLGLSSRLRARALHVLDENARVLAAVNAIQTNDWLLLGAILDAGHASLRDLYEVSRPEMDALVASLRLAGALGARMTGGGFGGCAVALFPAQIDVGEALVAAAI